MDRLTIINHMLSVVGESGVSSLNTTHPSVATMSNILDTEDQDFQGRGWWFNKEYRLTLAQDNLGKVAVPQNALEVSLSDIDRTPTADKLRYVRRGNQMYDAIKHTFVIGHSLVVDIVVQLPIDSMPASAASYLMRKAAEAAYLDDDGDTFKMQKLQERTALAWQKFKAKELTTLAVSAKDSPMYREMFSRMGQGVGAYNPKLIGGRP